MSIFQSTKAMDVSLLRRLQHSTRSYFGNRTALGILVVVAIAAGLALNWSWLVAAWIAPVALTALPCLVMCGLGLCMNKMVGPRRDRAQTHRARSSKLNQTKGTRPCAN